VRDKSETVTRGSSLAAHRAARNLAARKQRQEACCKAGDCLPQVVVDTTSKWTVYGGEARGEGGLLPLCFILRLLRPDTCVRTCGGAVL
jgi:hypothetical protein